MVGIKTQTNPGEPRQTLTFTSLFFKKKRIIISISSDTTTFMCQGNCRSFLVSVSELTTVGSTNAPHTVKPIKTLHEEEEAEVKGQSDEHVF